MVALRGITGWRIVEILTTTVTTCDGMGKKGSSSSGLGPLIYIQMIREFESLTAHRYRRKNYGSSCVLLP